MFTHPKIDGIWQWIAYSMETRFLINCFRFILCTFVIVNNLRVGHTPTQGVHNVKKWCTRFQIFKDLLKIQRFTESCFPKISWFSCATWLMVQNKMEISNKDSKIQSHGVQDSGFIVDPSHQRHSLNQFYETMHVQLACLITLGV